MPDRFRHGDVTLYMEQMAAGAGLAEARKVEVPAHLRVDGGPREWTAPGRRSVSWE